MRLLCAMTAKKRGKIHGGDVTLAYGQAKWPKGMKKIHAGMPAGYKKWYDNVLYCLSVGNLYGHLVAGKNWYMTMRKWHLDHGFVQSEYDPCAFHKTKGDSCLTILFYVDDILAFLWGDEGKDLLDGHVVEFGERSGGLSLE